MLLAHPGGPYWVKKDLGHWTIPKGEVEPGEELVRSPGESSRRRPGKPPEGPLIELGEIHQKSGKVVDGVGGRGRPRPGARP